MDGDRCVSSWWLWGIEEEGVPKQDAIQAPPVGGNWERGGTPLPSPALSAGEVTPGQDSARAPHPWPCLQVTLRLDTHPAMITVLEMGAARHFLRMQQLAKTQEERAQLLQPTLEINPR